MSCFWDNFFKSECSNWFFLFLNPTVFSADSKQISTTLFHLDWLSLSLLSHFSANFSVTLFLYLFWISRSSISLSRLIWDFGFLLLKILCHLILGMSQITILWSLLVLVPLKDLLLVTLWKVFLPQSIKSIWFLTGLNLNLFWHSQVVIWANLCLNLVLVATSWFWTMRSTKYLLLRSFLCPLWNFPFKSGYSWWCDPSLEFKSAATNTWSLVEKLLIVSFKAV